MSKPGQELEAALRARVRLLETTLQPATIRQYERTVRLFLEYLRESFPEIQQASQLRRDPHLLGWLEYLWKRRTYTGAPLHSNTRGEHVMQLRKLLDLLADCVHPPVAGLLRGGDIPRREYRLPRPLSPEDDGRLQQYWQQATDASSTVLLLQRLTGMRIGECADLSVDCLRHLGDNRWALHVPAGKPQSERWVPADDAVRVLVERLAFLRTLPPATDPRFLLPRAKGRHVLLAGLRGSLREAAAEVGIAARIVPHQLRHTYATSMLRAGMSLPALMKLLGHHNANMTLLYLEITQQDLQREFHQARLHPRYQVPLPPAPPMADCETPGELPAVRGAVDAACRMLELYRQKATGTAAHKKRLLLLWRRLIRIRGLLQKLIASTEEGK